jgi:antibiotic biosynthesis monooxygenase (ABM) superfamily enzyme
VNAVIYEVNLFVQRAIEREYREWLDAHIREILALPGFVRAEVFEVIDPAPAADEFALCTRYHVRDEAALQDYFREHAPRLRADGVARFGNNFRADRRVMKSP